MDANGVHVTANFRPDKYNYAHNKRDEKFCKKEKHIDPKGYHETIIDKGLPEIAFNEIFQEAINVYNSKQKRSDRRIKNYYELIRNDGHKGFHRKKDSNSNIKPYYELELKIGNQKNQYEDRKYLHIVLKCFLQKLEKEYKENIKIIGAYLHDDEFSIVEHKKIFNPPHLHVDFVFVAHSLTDEEKKIEDNDRNQLKRAKIIEIEKAGKRWSDKLWDKTDWTSYRVNKFGKALRNGPPLCCSMSGSLAELGYVTKSIKNTAQIQFEHDIHVMFQDYCSSMGIFVDRTKVESHDHMSKEKWIQEKELKAKSLELKKQEHKNKIKEKKLNEKQELISSQEKSLSEKQKQLKVSEDKIAQTEKSLNEKIKANKEFEIEIQGKARRLTIQEKNIESNKKFFMYSSKLIDEVNKDKMSLIGLRNKSKSLYSKTQNFESVLSFFYENALKLIIAAKTELTKYKRVFKSFWKLRPVDFRNLASSMERNDCRIFTEYVEKSAQGELDFQKTKKEKTKNQNQNNMREIDWSR